MNNSIYDIITAIAMVGSTKTKQQILEANKDNIALMKTFQYAESPRIRFWIKVPESVTLGFTSEGRKEISLETFRELAPLIDREVTGNAAKVYIQSILFVYTKKSREIISRIINKNLECNAGTAIANKVWPKLIEEYPCLLCSKMNSEVEKYLKQFENNIGYICENKEDGGRLLIKVDDSGNVTCHSRNGNILNLYGVFDSAFIDFKNTVFDGELLIKQEDGKPNRQKSNGIYTKLVRNTATEDEAKQFTFVVWDQIPLSEYMSGQGTVPYSVRFAQLFDMVSTIPYGNVELVEYKKANTLVECYDFYTEIRSRGEEGIIIKVANALWEDSRSKNYVKLKNESSADMLVVSVTEGSGKYAGMIGALNCESSCGKIKFSVGSGLQDPDREKDPSAYLGKIVEIKYNELITAKNRDTYSMFLPVFIKIRDDKSVPNSLQELL